MKQSLINILVVAMAFYSGCASNKPVVNTVSAHSSPSKTLESLEGDCQKAKQALVTILSPDYFKEATELTEQAREMFNKGVTLDELYAKISEGRAKLQLSIETARISQSQLRETLTKRQEAQSLISEANHVSVVGLSDLKEDFQDAEKKLLKLTHAIEEGKAEWARERQADVAKLYADIASKAGYKSSLDEVERLVQQAVHEGADKFAPKTLSAAQKKIAQVGQWISEKGRTEKEELARQKAAALFQARRLLQVTRAAKQFAQKEAEEIALWVEGRVYSLETALMSDYRDRHFDEQFSQVLKSIETARKPATNPVPAQAQKEKLKVTPRKK